MTKASGFFGALLIAFLWSGLALGAESLSDIFQKADQAAWGSRQAAVRKNLGAAPLGGNEEIITVADSGLTDGSTLNYLFRKNGALYNLAWYAATPVSDINAAITLESGLEKTLTAKYGKPAISHTDGKPDNVEEEVAQKNAQRAKVDEALDKAESAKGSKLTMEEQNKALASVGLSIFDVVPTIFYSKLNFWDGGAVWVVSNLLCSNDGTCYQHLQFVSKEQTKNEAYRPTPQILFSYTPLDRDQDLVTRFNRSLRNR